MPISSARADRSSIEGVGVLLNSRRRLLSWKESGRPRRWRAERDKAVLLELYGVALRGDEDLALL